MAEELEGVVKLIGIQGFVESEEFSIKTGQKIVIGRSRSCDISLRDVVKYLEIDPTGEQVDEHFRTVSRKHLSIQYISPGELVLEDLSSNGSFLDGKRMQKKVILKDIAEQDHIATLGSKETFKITWKQLVERKKMKIVEIPEGSPPPPNAKLYKDDKAEAKKEEKKIDFTDELDDLEPQNVSDPLIEDEDSIPVNDPNSTDVSDSQYLDDDVKEETEEKEKSKKKKDKTRNKIGRGSRRRRGPLKPPGKKLTKKDEKKSVDKAVAKSVSEQVLKSHKAAKSKGPAAEPGDDNAEKPKTKGKAPERKRKINRRLQRGR